MRDLIDANVWVALSAKSHEHYSRARLYWDRETGGELAFCRVTALALLRLLTNPRALGSAALDGGAAWRALETWLAAPQVVMLADPPGIDELLRAWSAHLDLRSRHWTDAYLAAFAMASGSRLVSFDRDFRRYPGLDFLHLRP